MNGPAQATVQTETVDRVYRDSTGNVLQDGDTVTVIKDLKLKGSAGVIKMGTKVKNIRLVKRRPRHRLQDRRLRRHEPEIGIRQEDC